MISPGGDTNASPVHRHPALQLRNLRSLVEIGVDKNTTVVFPAQLMSTIGELGAVAAHTPPTDGTAPAGDVGRIL